MQIKVYVPKLIEITSEYLPALAKRAADSLGGLVGQLGRVQTADVVFAKDVRVDHGLPLSLSLRNASVNSSSLPSSTAQASPTFSSVRWSFTIV